MISEGSYATEDWSNDAENYSQYLLIFQNMTGFTVFFIK